MKEHEAKTRWCPFSRMLAHTSAQDGHGRSFEGGYSYNRSADQGELYIPTGCHCIGSACMLWQWTLLPAGADFPGEGRCGAVAR